VSAQIVADAVDGFSARLATATRCAALGLRTIVGRTDERGDFVPALKHADGLATDDTVIAARKMRDPAFPPSIFPPRLSRIRKIDPDAAEYCSRGAIKKAHEELRLATLRMAVSP
jgi:hypothetical protein